MPRLLRVHTIADELLFQHEFDVSFPNLRFVGVPRQEFEQCSGVLINIVKNFQVLWRWRRLTAKYTITKEWELHVGCWSLKLKWLLRSLNVRSALSSFRDKHSRMETDAWRKAVFHSSEPFSMSSRINNRTSRCMLESPPLSSRISEVLCINSFSIMRRSLKSAGVPLLISFCSTRFTRTLGIGALPSMERARSTLCASFDKRSTLIFHVVKMARCSTLIGVNSLLFWSYSSISVFPSAS